MDVKSQSER